MLTFAILGGVLLNIGAFLSYKGRIYEAVSVYLFADVCWIAMAWQRSDWLGMGFITVGVLLGFLAFLKMQRGRMNKSLHTDQKDKLK